LRFKQNLYFTTVIFQILIGFRNKLDKSDLDLKNISVHCDGLPLQSLYSMYPVRFRSKVLY